VAVAPVGEGAAELGVAEALVPAEVFDFGFPWDAEGCKRERADADGETGAVASGYAGVAGGAGGAWWWGGEDGFFDAGGLPARHQAREVFGVREEGEDQLRRVRQPLFRLELEAFRHSFQ